jgi:negative regulator of sigma E activity
MAYTPTPEYTLIASLYHELTPAEESRFFDELQNDAHLQDSWLEADRMRDVLRSVRCTPSTGVLSAIKAYSQATAEVPEVLV